MFLICCDGSTNLSESQFQLVFWNGSARLVCGTTSENFISYENLKSNKNIEKREKERPIMRFAASKSRTWDCDATLIPQYFGSGIGSLTGQYIYRILLPSVVYFLLHFCSDSFRFRDSLRKWQRFTASTSSTNQVAWSSTR